MSCHANTGAPPQEYDRSVQDLEDLRAEKNVSLKLTAAYCGTGIINMFFFSNLKQNLTSLENKSM